MDFWDVAQDRLYLLFIYPKNVKDDLTMRELTMLRRLIDDT